jgi:hypothetical protein
MKLKDKKIKLANASEYIYTERDVVLAVEEVLKKINKYNTIVHGEKTKQLIWKDDLISMLNEVFK